MLKNHTAQRIAVIGLGAWGMALALHAARRGHAVTGWCRCQAAVKRLLDSGALPHGETSTPIPKNLALTSDLSATHDADLTIIALPAKAWSEVLPQVRASILVSATKGLESSTGATPLSYAAAKLGYSSAALAVISGPSFASDLVAERPISIVAASSSEQTATLVAEVLSGNSLRIYTSKDPVGVELGGILKNVIAIAAGVSDALGYGPSARAALISRGLAEMTRLATALGADPRTLSGLSGLGDLVMTATEDQSRNRTVGLRLGRGEKIDQIIASLGSVAEGVSTAPLVEQLAAKVSLDVPLTALIVKLLKDEIAPLQLASALLSRPLRSEF